MPRLTKRLVDQLTPAVGTETFCWDSLLPGFGVRVLPSGRKTYLIQYRDAHGRTRRYALGAHGVLTPEQARALAQAQLARVKAGENPSAERTRARQAGTVADLVARFLREHLPTLKPKTQRDYRLALERYILPALGTMAVPAVETDDIARLHRRLGETPYQANRVLSLCRTLFTCAERWHMRPAHSHPVQGVPRYPEHARERYLRPDELARLGTAMHTAQTAQTERPEAIALIRLLMFTGARLDEIRTLRWEWIDVEARRLRLPDSKTGAKTIYLSQPALEVLRGCGLQASGLVLPGTRPGRPQAHPQQVWKRLTKAAALTDVRPHDLRHTFASLGVALGVSLPIVGALLGHSDWATTQRYAHLAPNPVQQAGELVGEALRKALGG